MVGIREKVESFSLMPVKFRVLIPLCSVVPCVGLKCRELQLLRWWQGYFNGIDSIRMGKSARLQAYMNSAESVLYFL